MRVALTRHAKRRIRERLLPLLERDQTTWESIVIQAVSLAADENRWTRSVPDWARARVRTQPKTSTKRYVRFRTRGISAVAVVELDKLDKGCYVVKTVIAKEDNY
jgi:hypothetical protein